MQWTYGDCRAVMMIERDATPDVGEPPAWPPSRDATGPPPDPTRHPFRVGIPPGTAMCHEAGGHPDLRVGRAYRLIPDREGDLTGYLRVVDDSGEDYLYPAGWFRANVIQGLTEAWGKAGR